MKCFREGIVSPAACRITPFTAIPTKHRSIVAPRLVGSPAQSERAISGIYAGIVYAGLLLFEKWEFDFGSLVFPV